MFVVLLNNHTRILAPIYFGFVKNGERLIKTDSIYIYIYFFFSFILFFPKLYSMLLLLLTLFFFLAVLTTSAKIIFGLDLFNFLNWNQYNISLQ